MSQDQTLVILRTFGPIPAKGIAAAFGHAPSTVQSALMRLKRHGDVKYLSASHMRGRYGLWDAV